MHQLLVPCFLVSDFAIYTSLDWTPGTANPAIDGTACAVDVLGPDEAAAFPDNIFEDDGDVCFDVLVQSPWTLPNYRFRDNMNIMCEDIVSKPGHGHVQVETCYSWKTAGLNDACAGCYAVPSSLSVRLWCTNDMEI